MDVPRALAGLLALAKAEGVPVRTASFELRQHECGGLCRVRGRPLVLLDRRSSVAERAVTLADALLELGCDSSRVPREALSLFQAREARRRPSPRIEGPGLAAQGSNGRRQLK